MSRRSRGQPCPSLLPGRTVEGQLLSRPAPDRGHPPTSAASSPRHGGAQPYLPLQRHGPHGQVAHRLICDLPAPYREVIEGVGQLFGVILRGDLKPTGAGQRHSVPEGTWVDRWRCSPPGRHELPGLAQPVPPTLSSVHHSLTSQSWHTEHRVPPRVPSALCALCQPPGPSCCPQAATAPPAQRQMHTQGLGAVLCRDLTAVTPPPPRRALTAGRGHAGHALRDAGCHFALLAAPSLAGRWARPAAPSYSADPRGRPGAGWRPSSHSRPRRSPVWASSPEAARSVWATKTTQGPPWHIGVRKGRTGRASLWDRAARDQGQNKLCAGLGGSVPPPPTWPSPR